MTDEQRRPRRGRRFGRAARASRAAACVPVPGGAFDRVLALPRVDQALGQLLGHPRALQIVGILIGVVMVVLTLRPLLWPVEAPTVPILSSSSPSIPVPATSPLIQPATNGVED